MRTLFTKKMLFTLLVVLILAFCVACGDENVITGSGTAKGDKPTNSATDTHDKKDDDKQSSDKKDDKQPDG